MEGHATASESCSASSSSCAMEAGSGACTTGLGFHMPMLDGFHMRCLREDPTDEPESWSTGDLPCRGIFGNLDPRVHITPNFVPTGIVGQSTTHSTAGRAGTTAWVAGVLVLQVGTGRAEGAPSAEVGTQGAPAALEVGLEGQGSGGGPAVDAPSSGGAGEPTGGRAGWSGRRPCRQPRLRAFTLVKAYSRVGILVQSSPEACPVCLQGIRSGELARTLPCFHMLHNICSKRYFRTRGVLPTCPVCRLPIAPDAREGEV